MADASAFTNRVLLVGSAASIIAQNKSDLFVTKKANLSAVKSGGTLVYTVTVENLGPFRAAA